jgi:hypothetical protein
MRKRLAQILRRQANRLDPPEPYSWTYVPSTSTFTAGSNIKVTYR